MLVHVLGALLAASVGGGPHALRPDEICLTERLCARQPVYCLMDETRCDEPIDVCLIEKCDDPRPLEP